MARSPHSRRTKVRNTITWHRSFVIVDSGVVRIQIGEPNDPTGASYCGGCDYGIPTTYRRCRLFDAECKPIQHPDYNVPCTVLIRCQECIEAEDMHKQYGRLAE